MEKENIKNKKSLGLFLKNVQANSSLKQLPRLWDRPAQAKLQC